MTKKDKILVGVFVAGGIGLLAYYFLAGNKAREKRSTFEEFEKAAAEARWNWAKAIHHVQREEMIENWTKNLSKDEARRAIEIAKAMKTASDAEKKELVAEGRKIMYKFANG